MSDELLTLRQYLGGQYEIERELGGGGMSRVFLATERAFERRVVIKVLAPELGQQVNLERFQQEIATSATLQHPQIVPVYQAGAAGELRYYVMPFIAGESLRARLLRAGRLTGMEVIRLLAPLARALAYAHRQGIVHRDVKPENILLSEGEPMLADFGIAKMIREGASSATRTGLTSAGTSIGTVTYMPPEQVTADPTIDGRADVYSLAAVGYELLTGKPPFEGSPAQVMSAHVVQAVPSIIARAPETLPALAAAIERGLEKEPSARPDAETFAVLIDAAGRAATVDRVPSASTDTAYLRRLRVALVTTLVVAILGVAAVWATRGRTPAAPAREPAIAVLPFEMIGSADDAYLSAGVTDEIMTSLAQLPGMRVLSRATIRAYADSSFTPAEYAAKLGVKALVEGSVQRASTQLRVSARLIDATEGSAIWSDRYERALSDLFATQREIGAAVGEALTRRFRLAGATSKHVEYAASAESYDLFLRGRFALRQRGEQGLRSAMTLFAEAATRDTAFARAHAGIAEAAALLPIYSAVTRASIADTVRASAARALSLDSTLGAPHIALGLLEKGLGRWMDGERELTQAVHLDPTNASAHQNLGELYYTLGRVEESRQSLARAAQLEPTDETIVGEFAFALLLTGEADSASRTAARAAAAAPGSPYVAYTQSVIAERAGDLSAAVRYMKDAAAAAPLPFFRGALARIQLLSGDSAAARSGREALAALGDAPGATFGRVIAGLPTDPPDATFVGLNRAVAEGDPFVVLLPMRMWWYDAVRADRRFGEIARRLGLPDGSTAGLPKTGGRPRVSRWPLRDSRSMLSI